MDNESHFVFASFPSNTCASVRCPSPFSTSRKEVKAFDEDEALDAYVESVTGSRSDRVQHRRNPFERAGAWLLASLNSPLSNLLLMSTTLCLVPFLVIYISLMPFAYVTIPAFVLVLWIGYYEIQLRAFKRSWLYFELKKAGWIR